MPVSSRFILIAKLINRQKRNKEYPLLDSVPIVFTGVNYPNIPLIQKYPNVSGFWDKPDYRKNVELIERIMGKCVIVRVSDSTALDK